MEVVPIIHGRSRETGARRTKGKLLSPKALPWNWGGTHSKYRHSKSASARGPETFSTFSEDSADIDTQSIKGARHQGDRRAARNGIRRGPRRTSARSTPSRSASVFMSPDRGAAWRSTRSAYGTQHQRRRDRRPRAKPGSAQR